MCEVFDEVVTGSVGLEVFGAVVTGSVGLVVLGGVVTTAVGVEVVFVVCTTAGVATCPRVLVEGPATLIGSVLLGFTDADTELTSSA